MSAGATTTAQGHKHAEAFALMWYACPCGHQERIWNSRDGVTPFAAACPSCGAPNLKHVRWREDAYAPDHKPAHGQRVWVGMTLERATKIAASQIARADCRISTQLRRNVIDSIYTDGKSPDMVVTGYGENAE